MIVPFDLNLAKQGAKLITRDGRTARIICYDRMTNGKPGKMIALVKGHSGIFENLAFYNEDGIQINRVRDLDLMIDKEDNVIQQSN